jgi:hypothetical protein
MCCDKIIKSNDIIYFKCNHAFHKECYAEWLKYSTYDSNICVICRNEFPPKIPIKKNSNLIFVGMDNSSKIIDLLEIKNILHI